MLGWYIEKPGSIEHLRWGELPSLQAADGGLIIKVHAIALNPVDYKVIINGNPNWSYPHVPGVDVAGEVVQIGSGVDGFRVGDRVACHTDLTKQGTFAEYAAVDALSAALIPEDVSYEQAAAVLCAGMTAYQAIFQKLNTYQKQTILIHAGAGGVGGYAIQLAKELGLKVFTTASAANHDWVTSLGADVAIDYTNEDVTKRIMEETEDQGVELILNTVSRATATEDLQRLAFAGQLAYIAGAPDLTTVAPFTLSPSIHEVALGAAHSSASRQAKENLSYMAAELMKRIGQGRLNPLISEIMTCDQLPHALQRLQARHVRGKIIVTFVM